MANLMRNKPKISGIPFDIVVFVLFLFFSMLTLAYLLVAGSNR